MNNLEKKYYEDDEDIPRERSNSYDSDSTRDGYATSQSSDNIHYDFDNELSDIDNEDEKNDVENMMEDVKINNNDVIEKKEVRNIVEDTDNNTPEIYKQATAMAIEYNIDNSGKVSIPYGIFMECKKTPDGPIVCVKRDITTIPDIVDNVIDEKTTQQEVKGRKTRKNGKFVKTKRRDKRDRISQASKKNRKKQKKGTKRRRITRL